MLKNTLENKKKCFKHLEQQEEWARNEFWHWWQKPNSAVSTGENATRQVDRWLFVDELLYDDADTRPAGPWPNIWPPIPVVSSGLKPSSSTGIPNCVNLASYVRRRSLCACNSVTVLCYWHFYVMLVINRILAYLFTCIDSVLRDTLSYPHE